MVSKNKKNDEENKVLVKIDNKWEWLAFVLKYRMKEFLIIVIVILIFILVMQGNGFDFIKFVKSWWQK